MADTLSVETPAKDNKPNPLNFPSAAKQANGNLRNKQQQQPSKLDVGNFSFTVPTNQIYSILALIQ